MRNMLKDLMQENHTLRGLLRSLAAFIGEGAGGLLPKLGWDMGDFNNFVNRTETDTAWEGYQRRKKSASQPGSSSSAGQKRAAEDDGVGSSKKARGAGDLNGESERGTNGFPVMVPMDPAIGVSNGYATRANAGNGLFNDLIRNGSPIFMPSPASSNGAQFASPMAPPAGYQSSFMSGLSMSMDPSMSFPLASTISQQRNTSTTPHTVPEEPDDDDDPNKHEVYKLVHYHLANYKRNTAYCLPSSLRPTLVQRTVPHESVIDEILHPELRDRMILLRKQFDLVDCLHEYRLSVVIHGDDVLAHSNWELSEKWLRKFPILVDPATLAIANKWRSERGEPELLMADVNPGDTSGAS
ncbi:hypothetical protein HGRIS_009666 [Hohenbuehelia grisea]|uniref:Uncharacterized protein n=1 Tax=Hohenbuehelia grisea TaxID=104357 RepID=A0ABR3J1U8_9AGAR